MARAVSFLSGGIRVSGSGYVLTKSLKSLSLDENFIFSDIAKIYFLNLDINNFDLIYRDNSEEIDNFFIKAISRLKNENS